MKDPAFLFYSNDFISGTQFLTHEQVGVYIRLLCAQHQHGHLSEKQVKIISITLDNEVLNKFTKDENGNYYNERLEIEINRRKAFSESRSTNRKGKTKAKLKGKKTSSSYVNHMETENETINEDKLKDVSKNLKSISLEYLNHFNGLFGTKYQSTKSIEPMLKYWLTDYSIDQLKEALDKAKRFDTWTAKMLREHPEKMLRQKNKNGNVDYIGEMLNTGKNTRVDNSPVPFDGQQGVVL